MSNRERENKTGTLLLAATRDDQVVEVLRGLKVRGVRRIETHYIVASGSYVEKIIVRVIGDAFWVKHSEDRRVETG